MKTKCTGFLFFMMVFVLTLFSCGKKPEEMRIHRSIVFFGDSVTFGYGVNPETESFYARINNIMKSGLYGDVVAINAGVSGDDTSEALRRMADDVNTMNPSILILAFGLNDCQNKTISLASYRENIAAMIAAAPPGTEVVLATSNTFLESGQPLWKELNETLESYMDELRKIAREKRLVLIDVNDAWKIQLKQDQRHMETLYVDPTHPSPKGHRLIYETYMRSLRRILMK